MSAYYRCHDPETVAYSHMSRLLQKSDPNHQLLVDLAQKSALFDEVATKYSAKAAS